VKQASALMHEMGHASLQIVNREDSLLNLVFVGTTTC